MIIMTTIMMSTCKYTITINCNHKGKRNDGDVKDYEFM